MEKQECNVVRIGAAGRGLYAMITLFSEHRNGVVKKPLC